MRNDTTPLAADFSQPLPAIRKIGLADLRYAVSKGLDDFNAMPSHAFFIGLLCPVIGLLLGRAAFGYDLLPLLFPLAAGFALVGPLAAIGFYEMSRRRELGLDVSARHIVGVLRSPSIGGIAILGVALMLIFVFWLWIAESMYVGIFGDTGPVAVSEFARNVFETEGGRTLIVIGNAVGFLIALATFAVSVVSFPMLLDRKTTAARAVVTSIRAVAANPVTMLLWGLFVALSLAIGSLPFLVGLVIVVPVLGHATWHLYRRVVER